MRFCTFFLRSERPELQRAGIVKGSLVYELNRRSTMLSLLEEGLTGPDIEEGEDGHEMGNVVLRAPVQRPGKILATIVNTQGMLGGKDVALDRPRIDMKVPSAVVGPGERILAPPAGIRPEVELAAVVGKRMTGVSVPEAEASIFGYTILNDVTAPRDSRDDAYEAYRRERTSGQIRKVSLRGPLFRSKNHDAFCPMGPWVVTRDEADWDNVGMRTRFSGRLVQDGSTSEYLFTPAEIASYVSGFLTLEPGDVLSCGSVGWTADALGSLDPTEFILPVEDGVLELEVDGIGKLSNPVVYGGKDSIREPVSRGS